MALPLSKIRYSQALCLSVRLRTLNGRAAQCLLKIQSLTATIREKGERYVSKKCTTQLCHCTSSGADSVNRNCATERYSDGYAVALGKGRDRRAGPLLGARRPRDVSGNGGNEVCRPSNRRQQSEIQAPRQSRPRLGRKGGGRIAARGRRES